MGKIVWGKGATIKIGDNVAHLVAGVISINTEQVEPVAPAAMTSPLLPMSGEMMITFTAKPLEPAAWAAFVRAFFPPLVDAVSVFRSSGILRTLGVRLRKLSRWVAAAPDN